MQGIDTTNSFGVSVRRSDDKIIFYTPARPLEPDDALVFAAWIVALAESHASFSFEEALEAVQST